jgi:hypothetical protein
VSAKPSSVVEPPPSNSVPNDVTEIALTTFAVRPPNTDRVAGPDAPVTERVAFGSSSVRTSTASLVETVTVSDPFPAIAASLAPVGTAPPDQSDAVPKSPVTPSAHVAVFGAGKAPLTTTTWVPPAPSLWV